MRDKKLVMYSIASGIITLMFIISVGTFSWMNIRSTTDVGAFNSVNSGSNHAYMTHCTSVMSQMECGILHSFQVSAVLTIIFGGVNTLLYLIPPRAFATFPTFVAVSGNCCQLMFAIISSVLFLYFKREYYTDDGVNREYDDIPDANDLSFRWSYFLWIVATCLTLPLVVGGYYELYDAHLKGHSMKM
jgi:hypothetical protein